MTAAEPKFCSACGTALPDLALSCPACHQLVHAARLEQLTKDATDRENAQDPSGAGALWREALALLPSESKQAEYVRARIASLESKQAAPQGTPAPAEPKPAWAKRLGPFAVVGAAAWKFKALLLLAFTKAKFLILGLTKLNTLFSMAASVGLYWSWFGWQFAVGFIGGIYIHEMGHVWALRQLGLKASAPMFKPGFGAFISLYDSPPSPRDDARIGLAGPLWGAGAGIVFWVLGMVTGSGLWLAVARSTAAINLFNLTPIWQLDGGRGFGALAFPQRLAIGGLMLLLWAATGEGIFFILLLGAAYRIFWAKDHSPEGDGPALAQFGMLLALFAAMLALIPIRR